MFNKIKKYGAKVAGLVSAFGLGMTLLAHKALAAADVDFASGTAAIQAVGTDNKSTGIGFIVAIFGITIIVGLVIAAAIFGKNQFLSMFGGRRRRR